MRMFVRLVFAGWGMVGGCRERMVGGIGGGQVTVIAVSPGEARWAPDRRVGPCKGAGRLLAFVEGKGDDDGVDELSAEVDAEGVAVLGVPGVYIGHGDGPAQRGAEASAGDETDFVVAELDFHTVSSGTWGVEVEADEVSCGSLAVDFL